MLSIPFLHPHYSFLNSTFLLILSSPFYSFPIYSSLFFHLLSMYNLYPFSPIYCPSPLLVSPLSTHSSLPFSLGVFSLPSPLSLSPHYPPLYLDPLTVLPLSWSPHYPPLYHDPLTAPSSIMIPSHDSFLYWSLHCPPFYLDPLTALLSILIASLPSFLYWSPHCPPLYFDTLTVLLSILISSLSSSLYWYPHCPPIYFYLLTALPSIFSLPSPLCWSPYCHPLPLYPLSSYPSAGFLPFPWILFPLITSSWSLLCYSIPSSIFFTLFPYNPISFLSYPTITYFPSHTPQ